MIDVIQYQTSQKSEQKPSWFSETFVIYEELDRSNFENKYNFAVTRKKTQRLPFRGSEILIVHFGLYWDRQSSTCKWFYKLKYLHKTPR